mmetsp:Transcript_6045/g.10360  ORF Transcript_6045/g.10360 Transcript_6045/m.10360 type:complete len:258 (+) Transcript_6045:635-1408(+)
MDAACTPTALSTTVTSATCAAQRATTGVARPMTRSASSFRPECRCCSTLATRVARTITAIRRSLTRARAIWRFCATCSPAALCRTRHSSCAYSTGCRSRTWRRSRVRSSARSISRRCLLAASRRTTTHKTKHSRTSSRHNVPHSVRRRKCLAAAAPPSSALTCCARRARFRSATKCSPFRISSTCSTKATRCSALAHSSQARKISTSRSLAAARSCRCASPPRSTARRGKSTSVAPALFKKKYHNSPIVSFFFLKQE